MQRTYSFGSPHYWKRMGRREFAAWVNEAERVRAAEQDTTHSWARADRAPAWQDMREKRDKARGR